MGINTFQMEIRKRFHQQRREALVLGRDDPREGCSISPGLPSNMWGRTVPEAEDVDGRKHTVLLRGRCGDGNSGTPLRGEIQRDCTDTVAHMTNQKGHEKLGKETFIFWLLNTRCTQLRAKLMHSLNPPAVAEWRRPTTAQWDPNEAQPGGQGTWGSSAGDPEGDFV